MHIYYIIDIPEHLHSDTQVQCKTKGHAGSGKYPVKVNVVGKGDSVVASEGSDLYYYVDRWSSIYTWGGKGLPQEGEFIVIKPGDTVVYDLESSPILEFILVQGELIFEPDAATGKFIFLFISHIIQFKKFLKDVFLGQTT